MTKLEQLVGGDFPMWLGNAPSWVLVLIVLVTLIKTWPIIQRNLYDAKEKRETRYGSRIRELEKDVEECRRECDEHKREMHYQMEGLRKQHRSEQLALVRTIVEIFPDAPQLHLLLRTLELGERSVAVAAYVGETIGDAKTGPK